MYRSLKKSMNAMVCILVLLCLAGCSLEESRLFSAPITRSDLLNTVSPVLEAQKGIVSQNLEISVDFEQLSGEQIAAKALTEEGGLEYLEFCYMVDRSSDPEAVIEKARELVPDAEYRKLLAQVDEMEAEVGKACLEAAKSLPAGQLENFTKDLKKLLVKAIVLLTAGIVYACMPTVMLWGKVTAAAAISLAAGAVAVTVMSIYEYFQFGHDAGETFQTWLKEVITLPQAEYAIATSVIAMGSALNQGPVVSGIVLCVFAVFKVIEMVRPMMEEYNFEI